MHLYIYTFIQTFSLIKFLILIYMSSVELVTTAFKAVYAIA